MDWFTLALISAWAYASADAATKHSHRSGPDCDQVLVRFGLPGLLLLPIPFFYAWQMPNGEWWAWLLVSVPLEILAMYLYVRAIRQYPLSETLPYLAFTPVFTIFTGYIAVGEVIAWTGMIGIALVVFGAYVLNIRYDPEHPWRSLHAALRHWIDSRGAQLMLLVAAIYSITAVAGKVLMQSTEAVPTGAIYFIAVGLGSVLVFSTYRKQPPSPGWWYAPWNWLIAILMVIMILSHFTALDDAETAYMIAVKRVSLLFGILYGVMLFRERRLLQNLSGGGLMLMGVYIIASASNG